MKITTIDIWTVVVPTIPGRVHSEVFGAADWDRVPKHIIRLHTDEGLFGLGETGRGTPIDAVNQGFKRLEGRDPLKLSLQNVFDDAAATRSHSGIYESTGPRPRTAPTPSTARAIGKAWADGAVQVPVTMHSRWRSSTLSGRCAASQSTHCWGALIGIACRLTTG